MEPSSHEVRGKGERFADHYTQATLFWNSQTPVEKAHIINAFRFELSRVQTPAVRERMVSGLMNVAAELAEAVAAGLGMRQLPEPMPKVLQQEVTPEVRESSALSLFARRGDGGIRRVAWPSWSPTASMATVVDAFVLALAKHRHFDRESDPPRV